jgi:hypothetical protein
MHLIGFLALAVILLVVCADSETQAKLAGYFVVGLVYAASVAVVWLALFCVLQTPGIPFLIALLCSFYPAWRTRRFLSEGGL